MIVRLLIAFALVGALFGCARAPLALMDGSPSGIGRSVAPPPAAPPELPPEPPVMPPVIDPPEPPPVDPPIDPPVDPPVEPPVEPEDDCAGNSRPNPGNSQNCRDK